MNRIKYGWEQYGNSTHIGVIKLNNKVELEIVINIPKRKLFCTYFRRNTEKFEEKALVNADDNENKENTPKVKKIYMALVHKLLGHTEEYQTIVNLIK